jgi:hypothetical protein
MIRIERIELPDGLRAVAHRDANGDLVIYVSRGLDPRRQRAAIMEAVRASRRAGWRGVLPAGIAMLGASRLGPFRLRVSHPRLSHLAAGHSPAAPSGARHLAGRLPHLARQAATLVRAQPAWTGAVAAVAAGGVATGLVLATAAPGPGSSDQLLGPRPGVSVTAAPGTSGQPVRPRRHARGPAGESPDAGSPPGGQSGEPAPGPPGGGGSIPPPGRTPPAPGPTPSPVPTPAVTPTPTPTPSASSSPPAHGSPPEPCVDLLIIGICLSAKI